MVYNDGWDSKPGEEDEPSPGSAAPKPAAAPAKPVSKPAAKTNDVATGAAQPAGNTRPIAVGSKTTDLKARANESSAPKPAPKAESSAPKPAPKTDSSAPKPAPRADSSAPKTRPNERVLPVAESSAPRAAPRSESSAPKAVPIDAHGTREDRALLCCVIGNSVYRIGLQKDVSIVGRSLECDVKLDVISVSRRHCKLTIGRDGKNLIEDLKSSGGTFVGSDPEALTANRITASSELKPFSYVRFGEMKFAFIVPKPSTEPGSFILHPQNNDKPLDVTGDSLSVGRVGCDLTINAKQVSSRHALFECYGIFKPYRNWMQFQTVGISTLIYARLNRLGQCIRRWQ